MDLEQYTRMNDVIVTGLQTKPWSYTQAVVTANGGEPDEQDTNSTEQQMAAFLRSKGINLDCNDIEACHPLPRRNASDKLAIIMRFVNRKHKTALLKQGRNRQNENSQSHTSLQNWEQTQLHELQTCLITTTILQNIRKTVQQQIGLIHR